jgi:hypothetical protein
MNGAIHFQHDHSNGVPACDPMRKQTRDVPTTTDTKLVTCERCRATAEFKKANRK